jgi:hypothetical protein
MREGQFLFPPKEVTAEAAACRCSYVGHPQQKQAYSLEASTSRSRNSGPHHRITLSSLSALLGLGTLLRNLSSKVLTKPATRSFHRLKLLVKTVLKLTKSFSKVAGAEGSTASELVT